MSWRGAGFKEDVDDVFRQLEVSLRHQDPAIARHLDRKIFDVNEAPRNYADAGRFLTQPGPRRRLVTMCRLSSHPGRMSLPGRSLLFLCGSRDTRTPLPDNTPIGATSSAPSGSAITCHHYHRTPDSRRCQHYQEGGQCLRPAAKHGRCTEWLKVNAPNSPIESKEQPIESPQTAQTQQPTGDQGLFGNPVQANERPRTTSSKRQRSHPESQAPAPPPSGKPPLVRNATDEEIASFKALGAEVCIRTEALGDVHLVPTYTDQNRLLEISIEHCITLTAIRAAFPRAKVVGIKRAG